MTPHLAGRVSTGRRAVLVGARAGRLRVPLVVAVLAAVAVAWPLATVPAAAASRTSAAPGTAAAPGAARPAPPEPDNTYLRQTHQANLAEIQSGRDAQANGRSRCVRQVGGILVRDHRRLDSRALPAVGALGVELPTEPSPAQRRTIAAVKARAGSAGYDTAWLRAQEALHRQTLGIIDNELKRGRSNPVKVAASSARPVILMHLNMVRGGVCRSGSAPSRVGAGDGGQAADAQRVRVVLGAGLLGAGLLLIARAAAAALRRRAAARME